MGLPRDSLWALDLGSAEHILTVRGVIKFPNELTTRDGMLSLYQFEWDESWSSTAVGTHKSPRTCHPMMEYQPLI